MPASGRTSPTSIRATVVLPDPDSPTIPSEPPAGTVKVTPSAAVCRPPPGSAYVLRSPSTAGSGASSVVVMGCEAYADRVEAVLTAPHTPTGITAESLTGLLVADALLLAPATLDEARAVESSHQLTALREQLLDPKRRG